MMRTLVIMDGTIERALASCLADALASGADRRTRTAAAKRSLLWSSGLNASAKEMIDLVLSGKVPPDPDDSSSPPAPLVLVVAEPLAVVHVVNPPLHSSPAFPQMIPLYPLLSEWLAFSLEQHGDVVRTKTHFLLLRCVHLAMLASIQSGILWQTNVMCSSQ